MNIQLYLIMVDQIAGSIASDETIDYTIGNYKSNLRCWYLPTSDELESKSDSEIIDMLGSGHHVNDTKFDLVIDEYTTDGSSYTVFLYEKNGNVRKIYDKKNILIKREQLDVDKDGSITEKDLDATTDTKIKGDIQKLIDQLDNDEDADLDDDIDNLTDLTNTANTLKTGAGKTIGGVEIEGYTDIDVSNLDGKTSEELQQDLLLWQ